MSLPAPEWEGTWLAVHHLSVCVCVYMCAHASDRCSSSRLIEPANRKEAAAASLSLGRDPGYLGTWLGGQWPGRSVLGWGCWRQQPLLTCLNNHKHSRLKEQGELPQVRVNLQSTSGALQLPHTCLQKHSASTEHYRAGCARSGIAQDLYLRSQSLTTWGPGFPYGHQK